MTAGAGGNMSGTAGSGSTMAADTPLRVFIASDSTASNYKDTGSDSDQAGWGQMLPDFVKTFAKVDNRAIGGRTARRFIDEGRLDEIWAAIKPGDYLLVQFGTNDGNKNATYELNGQTIPYYLDPATDFKTYVRRYIAGAKERGAVPVLVTPPPRNSAYCTGGNGTGAHAQALRELGDSEQVGVVDLNNKTVTYLQAICPEPSPPDFFLQKADGSVDGTHFQERGARKLASFVAEGLQALTVTWIKD
jgi:lysophospholipase L1-like esterase